jgi:phenylalanine-4-hydroxylase
MIITKKDKDAILNVLSDITELNGFGENYIKNIMNTMNKCDCCDEHKKTRIPSNQLGLWNGIRSKNSKILSCRECKCYCQYVTVAATLKYHKLSEIEIKSLEMKEERCIFT